MNAEQIARKAHEGQVEKWGEHPYAQHLERVVALVEGEDAKAVAWLHDILEDTPTTTGELLSAGISQHVVDAVQILTRGMEKYSDYITRVYRSGNPLALAVKIADLKDHLREETQSVLPAGMWRRYEQALGRLTWQELLTNHNRV